MVSKLLTVRLGILSKEITFLLSALKCVNSSVSQQSQGMSFLIPPHLLPSATLGEICLTLYIQINESCSSLSRQNVLP